MKTGTLVGGKKTNILPITECFNLHSNVFQKKFLIKKKKNSKYFDPDAHRKQKSTKNNASCSCCISDPEKPSP